MQFRAARQWSSLDAELEMLKEENGGVVPIHEYVPISQHISHNSLTTEGVIQQIDFLTGNASNTGWAIYTAPFSSDTTPSRTWNGDWGAAVGGLATEFTAYDAATRPALVFPAAAATDATVQTSGVTASDAFIVSAGTSDTTLYGMVLTNNNTKQYDAGSAICLAASRYADNQRPIWSAGLSYALQYIASAPSLLAA